MQCLLELYRDVRAIDWHWHIGVFLTGLRVVFKLWFPPFLFLIALIWLGTFLIWCFYLLGAIPEYPAVGPYFLIPLIAFILWFIYQAGYEQQ